MKKIKLCGSKSLTNFRQQKTEDLKFSTKHTVPNGIETLLSEYKSAGVLAVMVQNTLPHHLWRQKGWRCKETLRMVTLCQRPRFSLPYWLQSQERHINRQCFAPLGYSPSLLCNWSWWAWSGLSCEWFSFFVSLPWAFVRSPVLGAEICALCGEINDENKTEGLLLCATSKQRL